MKDDVDLILEQWAVERPDVDTSPMGIVGRIARLGRAHDRAVGETLARHDLRPDEFDVLATLRRNGAPFQLTPTQLGGSMMVTSATMTHRLDKLEHRDLIARRPDPTDRRGLVISLTPRGRAIVDRALVDHVATEENLLAGLSERERKQLAGLLRRLAAQAVGTR